ncbi:MAG: 4a-hydroxytetrahydrobiopterin dehydratase [Xanthomonadales bacterium]|nr:4a-hydroxytetrahydrobiopterin dehydratase [Gammaproteobacteria bacterium]NNE04604.1 4a-hydroxytetrahydrobiopterin dehydratase [Xanthomonadales bacterium]NNL94875.1 4a-hydroxytetrahydrobiopterin dehydratase [Xanthomonadales bacterium]
MERLLEKKCKPCEGGAEPLAAERVRLYLGQLENWQADPQFKAISCRFEFPGFYKTMSFINALAWIANRQGHHPDFVAGYNYCDVTFTTHAINGLSENDFICAARVNALMENQ